jgi:hypothetical protein
MPPASFTGLIAARVIDSISGHAKSGDYNWLSSITLMASPPPPLSPPPQALVSRASALAAARAFPQKLRVDLCMGTSPGEMPIGVVWHARRQATVDRVGNGGRRRA